MVCLNSRQILIFLGLKPVILKSIYEFHTSSMKRAVDADRFLRREILLMLLEVISPKKGIDKEFHL